MATLIYSSRCLLLPEWLPYAVEFARCVFCTSEIILVDFQPHFCLLVSHSDSSCHIHCTTHQCTLVLLSFENIMYFPFCLEIYPIYHYYYIVVIVIPICLIDALIDVRLEMCQVGLSILAVVIWLGMS
jgi:hypothetical protein